MRCPKCGYNSFDHLDSCKKCGKDLVEFKQNFGIKSVLFPGQMGGSVDDAEEFDDTAADIAVSVATGAAAAATATVVSDADDGSMPAGTDGDDFGFDFMGDSSDDDDLSFDELFEEAPEDEDIEETIEGPTEAKADDTASSEDDLSSDLPEDDAELEDDFGFDPQGEEDASTTEDDFSFDDGEPEDPTGEAEDSGPEEDPKRPFDLPESSLFVGAPEDHLNIPSGQTSPFITGGEAVNLPLADEKLVPEVLSEGDTAESDLNSVSPVAPAVETILVEEAVPVSATNPAVVEGADSPATTAAAVADNDLEDDVTNTVAPPSLLLPCVKAFIYDLILLAIVGISFVVAAEAAMATGDFGFLPSLETLLNLSVPYFLVLFFLAFGYFTLFHFLVGQTPGKMLTGLRVETTEGEPLTFAQAFLRSVGGLFQLLPVGLGYLAALFNSERRGWNDRLAGTRVVSLRNLSGEN